MKLLFLAALACPLAAAAQQPVVAAEWAQLARYAAANQRLPPPGAARPRVVLLGNSITDSWPGADSAFFHNGPYELLGRGIGGQASPQMLLRFRPDVLALHPAVVVILAGTNDVAQNAGPYDPAVTLGNIESMVQLAQANGIRVVLASVPPTVDFWWRKNLEPASKIVALNQQLRQLAARYRAPYLDYHAALADERQGLPAAYSPDGVHPNLAGYRVMEPLLLRAVGEALKKQPRVSGH